MDGENLREASHERAVEVIRKAGNPVTFLVQSLVDWGEHPQQTQQSASTTPATASADSTPLPNGDSTSPADAGGVELPKVAPEPLPQPSVTPVPEVIQPGVTAPPPKAAVKRQETDPGASDEDDDSTDLQGRIVLPNGNEVITHSR